MSEPLKVFISYSWKSEDYKAFVLELATKLVEKEDFYVILDRWDLRPGHNINHFMEDSICRADKVLILCEKSYVDKANAREGGVGTETDLIITDDVYGKTEQEKFIPVLMEGSKTVPKYLRGRLGVRFGVSYTDNAYKELCSAIRGEAAVPRPSRASVKPAQPEQREAKKTEEPPAPVETPEQPTAQMPKEIESTSAPEPPAPVETPEQPTAQGPKEIESAPTPQKPARNGGNAPAREFEYEPCPGGVAITKYKGAGGDVVIPAELDGQPVVKIAKQAFDYCESLRTVSLPDSVTAIGSMAFNHCTGLLWVKLFPGLTRIGNSAFCECSSLTVIAIPEGVESIGQWAFDRCASLRVLRLPASLKRIGFSAFHSLSLENVYYSGTYRQWGAIVIEEINEALSRAVLHCSDKELFFSPPGDFEFKTLPEGVKIIRYKGMGGGVAIPAEIDEKPVVEIGVGAFMYCERLTSVTIPDSVTGIGDKAFYNCTNLNAIAIPVSVKRIGWGAFMHCDSLKDVYYSGSAWQWNAVKIQLSYYLAIATLHYRDGEIRGLGLLT